MEKIKCSCKTYSLSCETTQVHDCICYRNPEACRAYTHLCCCEYTIHNKQKCRGSMGHTCMCFYDPSLCQSSYLEYGCPCTCILNSPSVCRSNDSHLCSCEIDYKKCRSTTIHTCVCKNTYLCLAKDHECTCTDLYNVNPCKKKSNHNCRCQEADYFGRYCSADKHKCICVYKDILCLSDKHECICVNLQRVCKANILDHKCICDKNYDLCRGLNCQCICSKYGGYSFCRSIEDHVCTKQNGFNNSKDCRKIGCRCKKI